MHESRSRGRRAQVFPTLDTRDSCTTITSILYILEGFPLVNMTASRSCHANELGMSVVSVLLCSIGRWNTVLEGGMEFWKVEEIEEIYKHINTLCNQMQNIIRAILSVEYGGFIWPPYDILGGSLGVATLVRRVCPIRILDRRFCPIRTLSNWLCPIR